MSFSLIRQTVILLTLLLSAGLFGTEIPVSAKWFGGKGIKIIQQDNKLCITIDKTVKKLHFASVSLNFAKPQDWHDYRDVRFNIRSNQKILVKCSFGQYGNAVNMTWPRWTVNPEDEKSVVFERSTFKTSKGKDGSVSAVRMFSFGFGLWNYDSTKESVEIEISGIQVTQPSDIFIIPRPTAGVNIDGEYKKDWGYEDVLYFWTPPAYITLDASRSHKTAKSSPAEFGGKYSLMYDDNNIYFLGHVSDPTENQGGGNPWENDSIELFLANGITARNLKHGGALGDKGIQIIFDNSTQKALLFRSTGIDNKLTLDAKFRKEPMNVNGKMVPGYAVEAAIPRKLLTSPCDRGSLLAHAVKINDRGGSTFCTAGECRLPRFMDNMSRAYFEFEGKEEKTEYKFCKQAENPLWPQIYNDDNNTKRIWDDAFCAKRKVSKTRERMYLNGLWAVQGGSNLEFSPVSGKWSYVPVPMNIGWATPAFKLVKGKLTAISPELISRRNSAFWYERQINIPAEWKNKQIILNSAYIPRDAFVYIDEKAVGYFTAAKTQIDITKFIRAGSTHRLNILVDGRMKNEMRITGGEGGLNGDVYLEAHNKSAVISDVWARKADGTDKSFRFEVTSAASGKIRIILDDPAGKRLAEMEKVNSSSQPAVFEGRAENAPEWNTDTPALCRLTVQQLDDGGKLLDEAVIMVGFRKFESKNARFYLNGKKLRMRIAFGATPANVYSPGWLEEMRRLGYNAINLHAGAGSQWLQPLYELLDRKGFLVQAPIPPGQEDEVERIIRKIRNHPSVIGYISDAFGQLNTNGAIHNPFETDDTYMPQDHASKGIEGYMARRDSVFRKADPERRYIAQATGNWRDYMRATHHYATNSLNLLDRMMYHYPRSIRKNPKLPLVINEAGGANILSMDTLHPTHLWPVGSNRNMAKRLLAFEAAARYLGDRAFTDLDEWKKLLIRVQYLDYRLNGVDGFTMWNDSDLAYDVINYTPHPGGLGVKDKRKLSWRYFVPPFSEVIEDSWMRINSWYYRLRALTVYPWGERYGNADLKRKENVFTSLYKNESQPLFLTIVGKENDTFSQDHNYYGGETLSRRIATVNDTLSDQMISGFVELNINGKTVQKRKLSGKAAQGETCYLPFSFKLPVVKKKTPAEVVMKMSGRTETLKITLFPAHKRPVWNNMPRIGIAGKNGIAGKAGLKGLTVNLKEGIPADIEVLIIERNALVPDINASALASFLAQGGRILVMEQDDKSLLHYRAQELRLEHGFIADTEHPVVAGLDDEDIANWRGRADIVSSEKRPSAAFRYSQSTSLETPHLTNRNIVSAFPIVNPSYGSIHPVITGGFDRGEALVLEARSGKGRILFCQADVTPRYGVDPAATILADNLLKTVCSPMHKQFSGVLYSGDKNGRSFLDNLGINVDKNSKIGVLGKNGDPAELAGCRDIVVLPEADFLPAGVTVSRKSLRTHSYPLYRNTTFYQLERLKGELPGTDFPSTAGAVFAGTSATDFYLFSNPAMKCWKFSSNCNGKISRYGNAAEVTVDNIRYILCALDCNLVKTSDEREKIFRVWSVIFNNLKVSNQHKISFAVPSTDISRLTWDFVTDPDGKGEKSEFSVGNFGSRKVRKLVTGKIWEDQGITEHSAGKPAEGGYDGYGWYFAEVELPEMPDKISYFHVGGIRDISTFKRTEHRSDLFINGRLVSPAIEVLNAHLGGRGARVWAVDKALLKVGKNKIAIRVYNSNGAGGIHKNPLRFEHKGKNPDVLFPYEYKDTKYSNYFFWSW
ncbi:MAG: hypothetical protein J6C40_10290 [Lentisphaeria bacterium]|nr:hypothetical protein [Lentisphaeria bacterium]